MTALDVAEKIGLSTSECGDAHIMSSVNKSLRDMGWRRIRNKNVAKGFTFEVPHKLREERAFLAELKQRRINDGEKK